MSTLFITLFKAIIPARLFPQWEIPSNSTRVQKIPHSQLKRSKMGREGDEWPHIKRSFLSSSFSSQGQHSEIRFHLFSWAVFYNWLLISFSFLRLRERWRLPTLWLLGDKAPACSRAFQQLHSRWKMCPLPHHFSTSVCSLYWLLQDAASYHIHHPQFWRSPFTCFLSMFSREIETKFTTV